LQDRITVPRKHGAAFQFSQDFRDALFIRNPDDLKILESHFPNFKDLSNDFIQRRVRRKIPEPKILYSNLFAVYNKYKDIQDNLTKVPLFDNKTKAAFESILSHVKAGCVSDIPGISLYYEGDHVDGIQTYRCVRGSNKDETVHKNFLMFSPWKAGVELGECILFDQIFR
jgi:hypothetical protein